MGEMPVISHFHRQSPQFRLQGSCKLTPLGWERGNLKVPDRLAPGPGVPSPSRRPTGAPWRRPGNPQFPFNL